jgi:hypothetical protein
LRQAALGRLADEGAVGQQAERLLGMEPGLRDAWLAYLALAPDVVIGTLLGQPNEGGWDELAVASEHLWS